MNVLLPERSGKIVGAMFRCRITQAMLADKIGMERTWMNRVLNMENPYSGSMLRIEDGLRSLISERGFNVEEIYPTEKRPT